MKTKLRRNAGSAPSAVATIGVDEPEHQPAEDGARDAAETPRMMMMNAFRSGCSPIIGSQLEDGRHERAGRRGQREADREGQAVDHVHVHALQRGRLLVLLDGAHRRAHRASC